MTPVMLHTANYMTLVMMTQHPDSTSDLETRELTADQVPALLEMVQRCSKEALFRRFHGFSDGRTHVRQLARGVDSTTVTCWCGDQCVGFGTLGGTSDEVHVG